MKNKLIETATRLRDRTAMQIDESELLKDIHTKKMLAIADPQEKAKAEILLTNINSTILKLKEQYAEFNNYIIS